MGKFEVPENPEYTEDIRKFETTDPGHADLLNAVVQALVNNEAFLKKMAEQHTRDKQNPHGLTPESIGAPSAKYMAEHFVPDYVSQYRGGISSEGWYRIAQASKAEYGASCVVGIKRGYNSPAPEYQKVQFVDSYHSNKIIPIVSFIGSDGKHLFTKIRKTNDAANSISYIEIYQDRDTSPNGILVTIEDSVNIYGSPWEAIAPEPTQETVEGISVLASLDLPANFDISMLLKKSGDTMDGIINFVNNGGIRFITPNLTEVARGIDIFDKNGNKIGGVGTHSKSGVPDFFYASLAGNNSHSPAAGLSIYADKMKWKNSNIITDKWDFLGLAHERGNSFSYDTSSRGYAEYLIVSYDGEYFDEFSFHYDPILDSFKSYDYGAIGFNIRHEISAGDVILITLNGNVFKFTNNTNNMIARIYAR